MFFRIVAFKRRTTALIGFPGTAFLITNDKGITEKRTFYFKEFINSTLDSKMSEPIAMFDDYDEPPFEPLFLEQIKGVMMYYIKNTNDEYFLLRRY